MATAGNPSTQPAASAEQTNEEAEVLLETTFAEQMPDVADWIPEALVPYWATLSEYPIIGSALIVLVFYIGLRPQLDRNYGGILIVWDRLFGTFEPEGERVIYGLTKDIDSHNPVTIAFHEWRALVADMADASSWRDRAAYASHHPGWQPETARAVSGT